MAGHRAIGEILSTLNEAIRQCDNCCRRRIGEHILAGDLRCAVGLLRRQIRDEMTRVFHEHQSGIFIVVVLGVGLLAGCAMNSRRSMAGFALSTPHHHHDWDRLQTTLKAEGVHYMDAGSDLGTRWLSVERRDFTRARHIAEKLVTDESLTIRLNKDLAGRVCEVYENGAKVGEES